MAFLEPRPLKKDDPVAGFDCGKEALNTFLRRFAFQNQQNQSAKTYVTFTDSGDLAGYYTLAYGAVERDEVPARVGKGLAKHPIPVLILARLAVSLQFHKQGLGKHLLRDALLRTLKAAEIAGLRAVVVQAKDEDARRFYQHYRFDPFPSDPLKLILLLKDLRALLAA